jgi:hypothetical protein
VYLPNSTGMPERYAGRRSTSTFAAWLCTIVILLCATDSVATPRAVWLFAGLHPVDSTISRELLTRAEGMLEAALRRGAPGELDVRIAWPAAEPVPKSVTRDMGSAHAALTSGLDRYLDMRMPEAAAQLEHARDLYLKHLGWLGSADPFVQASLYLAMARLADGDEESCRRVLQVLLRRLPSENLPLSEFPPELADLLDMERAGLRANSRLSLVSSPPGAHVVIDGRLRGRTPLTVDGLIEGPHDVRLEAAGHAPWVRRLRLGAGEVQQPVRLRAIDGDLGAGALERAWRADSHSADLRSAADAFAGDAGASAVIIGWAGHGDGDAPTLFVARFDRGGTRIGAIAAVPLRTDGLDRAIDEAAGVLTETGGGSVSPELEARFLGLARRARSPEGDTAHLVVAIGAGAGLAEQVSDPGVAPVPLVIAFGLSTPLDGGWEVSGMMRAQPLEPRAYLAVAGARYRPAGPSGALGLLVGGAFGQVAHTITDTETGRASVAGTVGVAAGLGLRSLIGGTVMTLDLVAVILRPDFTVHADLLVGAQIGL